MKNYLVTFGLIFLISIGVIFLLPEKEIVIEKEIAVGVEKELIKEEGSVITNSFSLLNQENFCSVEIEFLEEGDEKFCFQKPKLKEERGIEIDLTNNKALLYEQGKLVKIFPLLHQAPKEKWFRVQLVI